MNIGLGQKIRALRKTRNISQEVLAQYLGVSFQAVSKWENDITLPDVAMIPAIASFFDVSTDELFDFNRMETEAKVSEICDRAYAYRGRDNARSEQILRDGLRQYPGNDILLNNLLYTMRCPERAQEVIDLCTVLIESSKHDDVKYDALRILAETYQEQGEYALCKATIEKIPEIYFSKLELDALLLEGEDMYHAAWAEKNMAAENMIVMSLRLAEYYHAKKDPESAASQLQLAEAVFDLLKTDIPAKPGHKNYYHAYGNDLREKIEAAAEKLRQ